MIYYVCIPINDNYAPLRLSLNTDYPSILAVNCDNEQMVVSMAVKVEIYQSFYVLIINFLFAVLYS